MTDNQTLHEQRTRVILLGASNLVLGWPQLTQQLQTMITGPMDVYAACGMGRSYVSWSGFGIRRLPGIQDCGLWKQLAAVTENSPEPSSHSQAGIELPVRVLVTDIGNDLVYGRTPEETINAVRNSLDQIRSRFPQSRITVTELPLESVNDLGALRFRITRSLLFAGCRLTLPDVKSLAVELNQRLVELCDRYRIPTVKPQPVWYGLDPIHVLKKFRLEAFGQYFGAWGPEDHRTSVEARTIVRLGRPTAELRQVWGRERIVPQPSISAGQIQVYGF